MRSDKDIEERRLAKHNKVIKQWLEGATIEFREVGSKEWYITPRQDDISWRLDHEYKKSDKE